MEEIYRYYCMPQNYKRLLRLTYIYASNCVESCMLHVEQVIKVKVSKDCQLPVIYVDWGVRTIVI